MAVASGTEYAEEIAGWTDGRITVKRAIME